MTNKPEQNKLPAPKKGKNKGKSKKPTIKSVHKIGVFSILFMFFLTLAIFTFTPLYSIILGFLPDSYKQALLSNVYQSVIISENKGSISEPLKYSPPEPLPVLGENTGICFYFYSTIENEDKEYIDAQRLDKALHGKKIAEIIAVDGHKSEYTLNITTMNKKSNKYGNTVSSICQIFGKDYPITPKTINAIYVRPLKSFTPYKVIWSTTRTFYAD